MSNELDLSTVKVLNTQSSPVGAGFIVARSLAVTCAHVAQSAGAVPGRIVQLEVMGGESRLEGFVLEDGWSPPEREDVAFIKVTAPPVINPIVALGTASNSEGHRYRSLGFPKLAGYEARWIIGEIAGIVPAPNKRPMLQLSGDGIRGGMSGGPVFDMHTEQIVGMISEYKDDGHQRFVWATTVDTLRTFHPNLALASTVLSATTLINEIPSQDRLIKLKAKLDEQLNMSELRDLCYELGVDFDNLPEGGKNDKIRELVQYFNRRGKIIHLLTVVSRFRPDINTSNL